MGPAGRAEAIHFPSATLKAASREGGSEGAERIKQRRKARQRWRVGCLCLIAKRQRGSDCNQMEQKEADGERREVRKF